MPDLLTYLKIECRGKPILLDLFCGAGGAAMGYHRAGFEVVGVDIKPQPHYPFEFHQADALTYPLDGFDAYHASPPCNKFTALNNLTPKIQLQSKEWVDLIEPTRERLFSTGKPYIIENVPGAPLVFPIILCGVMFGLKVLRHRLFECSFVMFQPPHIKHNGTVNAGQYMSVCSMGGGMYIKDKYGEKRKGSRKTEDWKVGMGIDWMNRYELTKAIPPAYTEYIGKELMKVLCLK